jgi:hypothetical protein
MENAIASIGMVGVPQEKDVEQIQRGGAFFMENAIASIGMVGVPPRQIQRRSEDFIAHKKPPGVPRGLKSKIQSSRLRLWRNQFRRGGKEGSTTCSVHPVDHVIVFLLDGLEFQERAGRGLVRVFFFQF